MTMNKSYFLLLFCILPFLIQAQAKRQPSSISPYVNWSEENLNWNIAGNEQGQYPNVLSELDWRDLRGPSVGVESVISLSSKFRLKTDLNYKEITRGTVKDTDYAGDNRFLKTSELDLQADKGHSFYTRIELSYLLWSNHHFYFNTHIGYYGAYQTLYMLDGDVPLIEGKKLNSTYKPQSHGVIMGLETNFIHQNWNADFDISAIYLPSYTTKATWNLREELRQPTSFKHKSKGVGWRTGLHIGYQLTQRIQPFFSVHYTHTKINKGTDKLFKANGTTHTAQLNEVHSNSLSIGLGVKVFLDSL